MFTIFDKIQIKSILSQKIKDKEIINFKLSDTNLYLYISSKRKNRKYNIELSKVSGKELITILWKKIPKDIDNHFKVEMRNAKLRKLLN
jgi:hypothetical protein